MLSAELLINILVILLIASLIGTALVSTFADAANSADLLTKNYSLSDFKSLDFGVDKTSSQHYYVASKESDVYHRLECHYADRILPENKIYFNSKEEAEEAGYRACRVCWKN